MVTATSRIRVAPEEGGGCEADVNSLQMLKNVFQCVFLKISTLVFKHKYINTIFTPTRIANNNSFIAHSQSMFSTSIVKTHAVHTPLGGVMLSITAAGTPL